MYPQIIRLATRPLKVSTVHAVLEMTLAQRLAIVMVALGSYIGVAALTKLGLRSNVVHNAEIVCDGGLVVEVFSSLTRKAAIHSFSNVYHCAWKNGSSAGRWCCGFPEAAPGDQVGCCDTTLFDPGSMGGFGGFFHPATQSNVSATNTSAPSVTPSTSNARPSNTVVCSASANLTTNQNTPISKPRQQSSERVAIGVGVGIPLGVIAFGSLILLFREHRLRLQAENTAGIINDKRFNEGNRTGRALPVAGNHNAPQELGHEPKHPNELGSQEVYEISVHG